VPAPSDRKATDVEQTGAPSDQFETETAAEEGAPAAPTFGPPAESGEVGTLGPYRVVKQLGHGGMGTVYAAVDTRLNRKLALKVMLPKFAADPAAKERFLREARAAAQVTHDNVVTVYEADERDGVPYIAMQFLDGSALDEYLKKKGNPSLPQVLRIARETAAGLAAAHKIGLVHRDIKPGNLWLEAPNGRIKVLDFGLAKPLDTEVELTKSGVVVGTPA
jgi:serine/threonine protein kinase